MRSFLLFNLFFFATTHATSLSQIQPIQGFSSECTNAYNTPLQGCTSQDFGNDKSCSTKCIEFLEALTKVINEACKGSSALPNTLLGLFFNSKGTDTLCPNVLGSSGPDTGGDGPGSAATTSLVASPTSTTTSGVEVKTTSKTVSTTSVIASLTPSSTVSAAATTSNIISASTAAAGQTSQPGAQTSSMNAAASPSNKSRGGEGGTILDIGSSAPPNARLDARMWILSISFLVTAAIR